VGKTGWSILNAIASGSSDSEQLAGLAKGKLQSKKENWPRHSEDTPVNISGGC